MALPPAAAVSRRAWLTAAASGLLAGACGRKRALAPVSRSVNRFPILVPDMTSADQAAFAAFAPDVWPIGTAGSAGPLAASAFSSAADASGARWQISAAAPFKLPAAGTFAPFEPALREVNFEASTLIPGALDAFAGKGGHYAIPGYAGPWAVQYDTAVFQQLGLPSPAADWSIDDFEGTCAVITAAIGRGRVPHLQAALPPLVGTYPWPPAPPGSKIQLRAFGQFNDADLWGAFVIGFGGTVIDG